MTCVMTALLESSTTSIPTSKTSRRGRGNDIVVGSDTANVSTAAMATTDSPAAGGGDAYVGGSGADALFARDGLAERVDCGAQTDTGEADTIDTTRRLRGHRGEFGAGARRRRRRCYQGERRLQ